MSLETLRSWCARRKYYPSCFIYQKTAIGLFNISKVDAEMNINLEPLEKLVLNSLVEFGIITRIEVHLLSGLSLETCDDILHKMQKYQLIELVDFNKKSMDDNVQRILKEFEDQSYSKEVQRILDRPMVKQYQLTENGDQAWKSSTKTISELTDLNIVITANPAYLFIDNINPRHHGYEELIVTPELIYQVLNYTNEFKDVTGVSPLAVSSGTMASAKEVVNSNFWISLSGDNGKSLSESNLDVFVTSLSFDKWSNPKWTSYLENQLPKFQNIREMVVKSIASFFEMVDEVIDEELILEKNKMTWTLKSDLEIQMLINAKNADPIAHINAEMNIPVPNSPWKLVFLLNLEPIDELADLGLKAGRFQANLPRKGFRLEHGYNLWSNLMKDWGKKKNYNEYHKIIKLLVKHDCLLEILPNIDTLNIDVDNLTSHNKRGKQKWEFNRLRQLIAILEKAKISNLVYIGSSKLLSNIDDEKGLSKFIKKYQIEIIDDIENYMHNPVIERANQTKSHYLGNRRIPEIEEYKEMRRTMKKISFFINKGKLVIQGLEPFYEFKSGNVLESMYGEFYE